MQDLSKNVDNKTVTELLKANGIVLGEHPVVIDIQPTKTAGKSTVYCIAAVDLGRTTDRPVNPQSMNAFELLGQKMTANNLQRGKMTMLDTVIAAEGIAKGSSLSLTNPDTGEVIEARLSVMEQFNPFYIGQKSIAFTENGIRKPVMRNGKEFYRDTKVCSAATQYHSLIKSTVAQVI